MKVTVNENGNICLEEVFNGIELKSTDGESISICMRDGGFEMRVGEKWYVINNGNIKMMATNKCIEDIFLNTISRELDIPIDLLHSPLLITNNIKFNRGAKKIGSYTMVENSELDQLRKDSDRLKKLKGFEDGL